MTDNILLYEELSLNAHPSLQTQFYDGWILRFANGYTKRANSINPLYSSTDDLQLKITECEKRYAACGLPVVYKLTDGTDPDIEKLLEQQNYISVEPAFVMSTALNSRDSSFGDCVTTDRADEEWLKAYFTFSHYTDNVRITTAGQILENVKNTLICGRVVKDGVPAACGLAVIERGYAALQNIVVDEAQRGKGYGQEICESLMSAAKSLGAHTAYLQVIQENYKAVNLYRKLGFTDVYSYWYRVKASGI